MSTRAKARRTSALAAAGEAARRNEVIRILRSAMTRHRGNLAAVAADPEVAVSPKILHAYAASAGLDLAAEAKTLRDRDTDATTE